MCRIGKYDNYGKGEIETRNRFILLFFSSLGVDRVWVEELIDGAPIMLESLGQLHSYNTEI